eukprot:CAMPEP_0201878020 /NCGR_PEP_ID=MMETSP0902-20130614/9287_1 /ASSEMBLY_ACC=CAM_ASM_000551 /TAXON_ID=420261 /ORGANISM="Thalassiosira antarctica, Strain CCMP982" /LENGTH=119 /DNA_ID=CAMNT_0048405589 /DNA_START=348 /DNA_END=705 /DNA_ORIENTATION=-
MGFLQAVAVYDAGFVGQSVLFPLRAWAYWGRLEGDEVLGGLALTHSPFCATADVGFLVASGMDDEGLSARRRTFGSWCASGMGFCCRSDGGLGSEDKGTRVEAPCVGAKRGLGLCWSRM